MTAMHGDWFDGRHGVARPVQVAWEGAWLSLRNDEGPVARFAKDTLRSDEPFNGLPRVIEVRGGGVIHVPAAFDWPGEKWSFMAVANRWGCVAACALALVALVGWLDQYGVGLAADALVRVVPRSFDRKLGDQVLESADKTWLRPSRVDERRRKALRERFEAATPGTDALVTFRRTRQGEGGFNAFALPGNTIVLLDGLVEDLTDDEIMWVLGHELGHLQQRHGMRSLARSFGLGALASAVWGDFSTWMVTVGTTAPLLAHSRDAEREADEAMRAFGRRIGLPAQAQVTVWQKFKALERESGADAVPGWLSTHPATDDRLARAREDAARDSAPTR